MKSAVLLRRCFFAAEGVSLFLVMVCVLGNLWLDLRLEQITVPQSPHAESESLKSPWDELPESCASDENGVPILSDTKYVTNILLIGTDARQTGEPCRSDAMVLLSWNRQKRTMVLSSVLRDLYVPMEGHRDNKLNSAYAFGGGEYLCSVLRQMLNLDVTRYITVDFTAFSALVDALGGVSLDITAEEASVMNGLLPVGSSRLPLVSGTQHLNGAQALAYVRNRSSPMGDFDRTDRQKKLLAQIFSQWKQADFSTLISLPDMLLPYVSTNISAAELKQWLSLAVDCLDYEICFSTVPAKGTYTFETERGMSVIKADLTENIYYLYRQIY